jgi:hypothetical protein
MTTLRLLALTILPILVLGCASTDRAYEATAPEGVVVNSEAGDLTDPEAYLLTVMQEKGLPIPDSISIQQFDNLLGGVNHLTAPWTVKLDSRRTRYPNIKIPRSYPYLFAQTHKPSEEKLFPAYVLAHETAHIHGPRLNPDMGRPAFGLHPESDEVQAEILALLYMRMAFGTTRRDLGYPAKVNHPHIPDAVVNTLVWKYCVIVSKTEAWDASLNCQR